MKKQIYKVDKAMRAVGLLLQISSCSEITFNILLVLNESRRIEVDDNGFGMTPEYLEVIFDAYTRAENSTTNKVQGTGLGAAVTKDICRNIEIQMEDAGGISDLAYSRPVSREIHTMWFYWTGRRNRKSDVSVYEGLFTGGSKN